MKTSALQLRHYFVSEVTLAANPAFAPTKPVVLRVSDLTVEDEEKPVEGHPRQWRVNMWIKLTAPSESNPPYFFSLALNGVFEIGPKTDEVLIPMLLSNSAPSVLFGFAREYLRSLMSAGPYPALLLPTVVFPPQRKPPAPAQPAAPAEGATGADAPKPTTP